MIWNTSFFSTSGGRYSYSGKLYSVGSEGFYWFSTPINFNNGYYMYFHSEGMNPNHNYGRSVGISLRCIEDKPIIPSVN